MVLRTLWGLPRLAKARLAMTGEIVPSYRRDENNGIDRTEAGEGC